MGTEGCSWRLTSVEASSLNRQIAVFLLLTFVVGYFFLPTQAKAETTTPLVFQIDKSLSEPRYIHGPFKPKNYTPPKPPTQVKAGNTQAVGKVPTGYSSCSCVSYAKYKTGFTQSVGKARNWPTNSDTPSEGAVIITYESSLGHVGIVSHWDATNVYLESEANYSRCKMTYGRAIPIDSPLIKGYWKK